MLTGIVPSEFGQLVKLQYLYLDANMLSGSMPSSMGGLESVQFFYVRENMMTGPIPSTLGALGAVKELFFFDNLFDHSLPVELNKLTSLQILRLQHNLLTGSLEGVFNINMTLLENVDLSDNKFSGKISTNIFELPDVNSVALSMNCFEGSLPDRMCAARNVSVLSMDGLGAAKDCKNSWVIPLSGVAVFNTLEGSVPACLWSLPALQVLHLTGNGLTGRIGEPNAIGPSLRTVSLGEIK
jgi:hypothetical protein